MNREFPMTESEVLDEIRRQIESVGGSVRGVGLPLEEKMYESMVKLFKEHKRPVRRAEILKDIGHLAGYSRDTGRHLSAPSRLNRRKVGGGGGN